MFDFLRTDSTATKKVSDLRVGLELSAEEQLSWLLEKLDDAGMSALAVNITTSEAEEAGIHVVRVIIPELMPVSFVHQVRYLAHPRLYDAPAAMGYPVRSEPQLNHYPQPFA